jgi:arylsulfatase A-like enzyme
MRPRIPRFRYLPAILIGGGVLAMAAAISADLVGINGRPSFGAQQSALALAGLAATGVGLAMLSRVRARILDAWRASATAQPTAPRAIVLLAAWLGVLTGLLEVSVRAVQKLVFDQVISLSPHFVWMVPLTHLVIFTVAGLLFALASLKFQRIVRIPVVFFALATLGLYGVMMLETRLYRSAVFVLCAGASFRLTQFVTRSPGFERLVRRSLPYLAGVVVFLAGGVFALRNAAERIAVAGLPPPPAGAPNILLIVLDTFRARNLGLYGYARDTSPNLDAFAKRGVVFEDAFATSPWTLPSHGSLFTGRYPHELSANWNTPLDATHPVLAEALAARGYATAGFVGNLLYCDSEDGLNRGFVHYEDYELSPKLVAVSAQLGYFLVGWIFGEHTTDVRNSAASVNARFLTWLSGHEGRPFFAFLNYFDSHALYLPPPPFEERFGPKDDVRYAGLWWRFTDRQIQALTDAYDGTLAYVDHHFGLLIAALEERKLLDRTIVIITADHGEHLGEHGLMDHGNSLYAAVLHCPLVIVHPGKVPAGRRITGPVTLRDLPATVLDLIGLADPPAFPGRSLARTWEDTDGPDHGPRSPVLSSVRAGINTPRWFPVTKGDLVSLVENGYRYIRNGDGSDELYALDDPLERRNLASSPEDRTALLELRGRVDSLLRR